jgi:hypothetical protein
MLPNAAVRFVAGIRPPLIPYAPSHSLRGCLIVFQAGSNPTVARLQHALWCSEPWAELLSLLPESAVRFACQKAPTGCSEREWLECCVDEFLKEPSFGDPPHQWFLSHGQLFHSLLGLRQSSGPQIVRITQMLHCFGEACRTLRMEPEEARCLLKCFHSIEQLSDTAVPARFFLQQLEGKFANLAAWLPTLLVEFLLGVNHEVWLHRQLVTDRDAEVASQSLLFLSEEAFLTPAPWWLRAIPPPVVARLLRAPECLGEQGWSFLERQVSAEAAIPFVQRPTVLSYCSALMMVVDAGLPSAPEHKLPPTIARCMAVIRVRGHIAESAKAAAKGWLKTQTDEPPDAYICPITGLIMRDPVLTPDGSHYERQALLRWLETNPTSPLTRAPLKPKDLRPANQLASEISRWKLDRDELHALKPAV